jgi:hypothetical protein
MVKLNDHVPQFVVILFGLVLLYLPEVRAADLANSQYETIRGLEFDSQEEISSKSLNSGQFAKWHIFKLHGRIVRLSREYFTDESSQTYEISKYSPSIILGRVLN